MQKVKFDFEAEKQFIYAPNSTVPIGAPVDENGNIANDGNAIGIVLGYDNVNEKYWTKQMMVVMVGGYVDIIDAQLIWGDEYSAEAKAAMSDIIFCDNHKIGGGGGGGGWPSDLPKPSVGGYGYTEQGEQTVIVDNESVTTTSPSASIPFCYGQFATPFDIVDGAYTVIFNGTEYNLNSTVIEDTGTYIIGEVTESGYDFSRYPFIIANMNGRTVLLTESAGDYEITVKTESETIHKINDKFYESTVEFTIDQRDEEREPVSDIYNKCLVAVNSGKNVRLRIIDEYDFEESYIFSDISNSEHTISFVNVGNSTDGILFKLAVIGLNSGLTTKEKLLS